MQICRRFSLFIYIGLVAMATLAGCGGSSEKTTVPTTVSIFNAHSIIFRNNSAMTTGYNEFGQLGDGTQTNRSAFALVPGLGHLTGGAAGAAHTLAFSNQTSVVWAWGFNGSGQLGDPLAPTTAGSATSLVPVSTKSLGGLVTDVSAGSFHSLAVAGNSVWAWGENSVGAVGDGTTVDRNDPVNLVSGYDVDGRTGTTLPAVALAVAGGGNHSLALYRNGDGTTTVFAWGGNSFGQLGFSPYSSALSTKPRKVRLAEVVGNVEKIAAGSNFSLALDELRDGDGNVTEQRLWGWGYGAVGQLAAAPGALPMLTPGNTDTAYSFAPVLMKKILAIGPGTPIIRKIVAGFDHVLLLLAAQDGNGFIESVGFNFYGQLGNNMGLSPQDRDTSIGSFELVHVLNHDGVAGSRLTGVTDIAAFGDHSLAKSGTVWYGWGSNNMGQLGNPAPRSRAENPKYPKAVPGF